MANTDVLGFWKIAEADPDHIAIIDPDYREMTYGELAALTNKIGKGLRALGLGVGDQVTTVLPNCFEQVAVCLAASQIGLYVTTVVMSLGYHYYDQTARNEALWANAIVSRYPMVGKATPNDTGITLDVKGRRVQVFNIHLPDSPYQPYQLLKIPYGNSAFLTTAAEAEEAARKARGPGLALLEADLATARGADVILITGDFNEPSHLDWTAAAVAASLHPLIVKWPFTHALEQAGFIDTFRAAYPDEVEKPGFTWSPMIKDDDPNNHPDRIDYIFVRGKSVKIKSTAVVGENSKWTDQVIEPWPSDHRAVISVITF